MTRLKRITNKIFGETASTTGTEEFGAEIGQFGSAKLGTYNATGDVATIQSLPAWSNGWIDAVIPNQQYPTLPEMTGVNKVITHQTGYMLQEGIPEWDSATEYYKESYVKYIPETITYTASASIGISTGITGASVDVDTFTSQITAQGNYTFTFDGSNWLYNEMTTNLTLYGIAYTGTPAEDDEIIISLVKTVTQNESKIYISNTDNNINNNPSTDAINWREFVTGESAKYTKFAINKGNPDLLVDNTSVLSFDVDSNNPLIYTNIIGETKTVTSLLPIDVSAENDGTYKVVLPQSDNQPYLFDGIVFNQETEPTTQVQGDIWLNPQEPYSAKQYDGADWQDFNDVLLFDSSVTVASGVISALEQPMYNNSHLISNEYYISGLGMPSDRRIDLTAPASQSSGSALANTKIMTAPYDCYVTFSVTFSTNTGVGWVLTQKDGTTLNASNRDGYRVDTINFSSVLVKKGQDVILRGNYISSISFLHIIPTVGSERKL